MLIAAFIVLVLFLLACVITRLPVTCNAKASVTKDGFELKITVKLAHIITIFGWDSSEEGLSFLFKKKDNDEEKKKTRLRFVVGRILNPKSILNIKGMTVASFEISGVIATKDAARTALVYGALCSLISIIIPFIKSNGIKVNFYPDFQETHPDFHIGCIIKVKLIHIIYLIADAIKESKDSKDNKGKEGGRAYGTASN